MVDIIVDINIFIIHGRLKNFHYMKFIAAYIYYQTVRIRLTMYVMSALKQYIICSDFLVGKEDLWKAESNNLAVSSRYCQGWVI